MISDSEKEQVRAATDFEALVKETVVLKPRGHELWGCCPFHHEKTPSFKINPSTGLWHCFGCGKGGDVFAYVCEREHLDFPDAIRYLADRAGIELHEEQGARRAGPKKNRLIECMGEAEQYYCNMLLRVPGSETDKARQYFAGRGFGSKVCRSWSLGYAPGRSQLVRHLRSKDFTPAEIIACDLGVDGRGGLRDRFYNRVMFPIHDEIGRCIAFGGRVLDDSKPKYLNTKETTLFQKRKHLFAFHRAKEAIAARGTAIVCEGYTDVISMHEHGFQNCVAALGTSFSAEHVKALSRFAKTIICMFDGDAAGQRAAERAVQYIDKTEADLRCVVLPNNMDPMEFLAAHSPTEMSEQLAQSRPLVDFVFEKRLAGYNLSVPGQRVAAFDDLARVLAPLKHSVLLDSYARQLAGAVGADLDIARRKILEATPLGDEPQRRVTADTSYTNASSYGSTHDQSYDGPTYDDVVVDPFEDEQAPIPSPEPALLATPSTLLSADERKQIKIERELLGMMATYLDVAREFQDEIGALYWTDPRHQTIAWTMLALPQSTPASAAVAAAEKSCPDAAAILSASNIQATTIDAAREDICLLVNQVDFYSTRRRLKQISYELSQTSDAAETKKLFDKASELQARLLNLGNTFNVGTNSSS